MSFCYRVMSVHFVYCLPIFWYFFRMFLTMKLRGTWSRRVLIGPKDRTIQGQWGYKRNIHCRRWCIHWLRHEWECGRIGAVGNLLCVRPRLSASICPNVGNIANPSCAATTIHRNKIYEIQKVFNQVERVYNWWWCIRLDGTLTIHLYTIHIYIFVLKDIWDID
jgi:hypothetical protein